MKTNKRLVAIICAIVCACFLIRAEAQDTESIINRFDAASNDELQTTETQTITRYVSQQNADGTIEQVPVCEAISKSLTVNGSLGFGNSNWGSPEQYAPQNLQWVYKSQWMPNILPGWGPYGSAEFYPLHGAPGWSSTHYEIGGGDVIIAVNDRRVKSYNDLKTAMNKAGDVVALTVVDPKNSGVYCIALKVKNHRLPVLSTDNFLSKTNQSPIGVLVWACFPDFNGHVYKPTCPFPVD